MLSNRDLLAKTLQAEAGNQGLGGMMAVGSVIMNRVGPGQSISDIILAPGQFSAWNSVTGYAGGEQGQDMGAIKPSEDAYAAADAILSGNYADITGGATHYYNPDISQPKWGASAGGDWTKIGAHLFGKADAPKRGKPTMDGQRTMPMQAQPTAPQMQQMQRQPRGLMDFLRDPRTRQTLASLDRSGMFQGIAEQAGRDVQRQEQLEELARAEEKEQKTANRTIQILQQKAKDGDQLAAMVLEGLQSGALDAKTAMSLYMGKRLETPKTGETFTTMTGAQLNELQGTSLDPGKLYNVSSTGKVTQVGGGGVTIEGDKGVDKFAEQDAKTLSETFSTGVTAASNLNKINRLDALLQNVETGSMAALKGVMGNLGIETEGLGDIQAAQALINAMVPAQRPPGSGPMSDADLELFKQSLPRLINQPRGNEIIIETLRGIAAYDALGAEIVQKYRTQEISKAEAFQQLMSRPDPFGATANPSSYF